MKRNFLLMLLMTLLPLAGWADDVTVGDYTVSIATQYVALTDATTGVDAPAVTTIKSGSATIDATPVCILDAKGKKVDGKIKATGTYYLMYNFTVENTQKVMKVPFYVFDPETTAIEKEFIYDENTYYDSQDGGVYDAYLTVSPWSYVWDNDQNKCWYPESTTAEGKLQEWNQIKDVTWTDTDKRYTYEWEALWYDYPTNKLWEDFPTFGFVNKTQSNVVAVYQNGSYLGKIDFSGENPQYFLASVKDFWPKGDYTLPWPGNVDEVGNARAFATGQQHPLANIYGTFDPNYMMFYEVPVLEGSVETATDLSEVTVNVDCDDLPYNGAVQYPTFSGENFNAVVTIPATDATGLITLVEGVDFTPVYNAADDDYMSTGTHNFTVNFIGAYAGSKAATYNIAKAHVNINLAYIYKTYGEADPALPANPTAAQLEAYTTKLGFEIDASTPLKGADVKSDIAKYLIFHRATGDENQGEDVREYDYYYDKTADFAEKCNYTVSFLQTKSLLIIQPKAVTINVTPVYKKYHKTVEFKYDADALKAQLVEKDKASASGTPGASDLITSITWEGAGTDAGEAVNADLVDGVPVFRNQGTGYPMTATVAIVPETKKSNYNVTVAAPEDGFAIVPTDEADIAVEIPTKDADGHDINGAVNGRFIYKAAAYEPEPVVKDNGFTLTKGTDYTVTWNKNVDASADAECIVTLCGSYTSAQPITKKFTISQAELVVKPVSATAEGNYTIAYEGFKEEGESPQAIATSLYNIATTPEHAYFSVDPDAITVVKGEEIEQDVYVLNIQLPAGVTTITAKNYNVTIGDALLALNDKPILRVRPAQNQPGKVYDGQEPTAEELAALAIEVQSVKGDDRYEAATDAEKAALKILGTPVYTFTKAEGVNVGVYRLTVTGPAVLKDYNVEYDNTHNATSTRNYPIKPAAYFIVVNNDPAKLGTASKTYGSADPTFTLTAATRTGDGTEASPYVYTAATGVTLPNRLRGIHYNGRIGNTNNWDNDDAGTHTIYVQRNFGNNQNPNWRALTNYESGNYTFTSVNGELTIAKKVVTFTAEPKSKVYGTATPALTITPDPVETDLYREALSKTNGVYDAFNISIVVPEGKTGEEVGTYVIKLETKDVDNATEGVQLHNSLRNFDVKVQDGTFTINQATYFVRANDQWIHFNNGINPLDVTIDLPGGETLRWQKAGINEEPGETTARETNNAKIEALGSLQVVEGKDAIGANKDAYRWVPKTNANYALATGEAGSKTIPATAHTREYVYTDGFCNGYLTVYPLEYIPLDVYELAQLVGKDPVEDTEEVDADGKMTGVKPSLLQKVLEAHKGLTIPVKMPERALNADDWYTFVLPFPVKPSVLFNDDHFGYGALEILDAAQSKGNKVVFSLQMNEIPANTPFILKVENAVDAETMNGIMFEDVTIDNSINYLTADPTTGEAGNVQFVGLYYDKKGFTADQKYNAAVKDKTTGEPGPRGFYPGGDKSGSIVVKRTNAYLQFPSAESAARAQILIQELDGSYTAINGVEADTEATDAEGIYNLSGQRVNKAQKGIYIMNGKKVLVK